VEGEAGERVESGGEGGQKRLGKGGGGVKGRGGKEEERGGEMRG